MKGPFQLAKLQKENWRESRELQAPERCKPGPRLYVYPQGVSPGQCYNDKAEALEFLPFIRSNK